MFFLTFQTASSTPLRPNIVFILADDLGWADTTLYGHTNFYRPSSRTTGQTGMTFTGVFGQPARSPTCQHSHRTKPARLGLTSPPAICQRCSCKPPWHQNQQDKGDPAKVGHRLRTDIQLSANTSEGRIPNRTSEMASRAGRAHPSSMASKSTCPTGMAQVKKDPTSHPGVTPTLIRPRPKEHIETGWPRKLSRLSSNTKTLFNYWQFSVHAPFDAKKELIEKYRKRVNPKSLQQSPTYAAMVESMDDAVGTFSTLSTVSN